MSLNVLITGVSGYLMGTLLETLRSDPVWADIKKKNNVQLYGSVRKEAQGKLASELYGVTPLVFDQSNYHECSKAVTDNDVTIVIFTTSTVDFPRGAGFMAGLAEVKRRSGKEVHYLHTGGGKFHSNHAARPYELVLDDETEYPKQKKQEQGHIPLNLCRKGLETNIKVLETGEELDVRSYVLVPCIVYGKGTGFGNKISIQTKDIVRCGKVMGRVYNAAEYDTDSWAFCSIEDITQLYAKMLFAFCNGQDIPYGTKGGYYFAVNGHINWLDLYGGVAKALKVEGVIEDDTLIKATKEDRIKLNQVLQSAGEFVGVEQLGEDDHFLDFSIAGRLRMETVNTKVVGWEPKHDVEHFKSFLHEETAWILQHISD